MQIEKLSLQNFRCFERKEITFSPGFNVLIGDNGTGKTAVIDALAGAFVQYLRDVTNSADRTSRILRTDVCLRLGGTVDNPHFVPQGPVLIELFGTVFGRAFHWSFFRDGSAGYTPRTKRSLEQIVREVQTNAHYLPVIACYSVARLWKSTLNAEVAHAIDEGRTVDLSRLPPSEEDKPGYRLDGYRFALNAQANEEAVRGWIRRLELSERQRDTTNYTLHAVKQAVIDCLPEWSDFYFEILLGDLVVKNSKGEMMLTRLLSHGQRNILSLVADIAYRCVSLNPELRENATKETPGVVLIDELDLHLHPKWQRRIVEDLRRTFPKIQFIVTTHSPLIIQSLRPGELIDLGPEIDEAPEDYVGRSPEDILENVMEVPMPQRSKRSQEMIAAAERYYALLEKAPEHPDLPALRTELDRLMEPYEENEAYVAALRLERAASGIDKIPVATNGHSNGHGGEATP